MNMILHTLVFEGDYMINHFSTSPFNSEAWVVTEMFQTLHKIHDLFSSSQFLLFYFNKFLFFNVKTFQSNTDMLLFSWKELLML